MYRCWWYMIFSIGYWFKMDGVGGWTCNTFSLCPNLEAVATLPVKKGRCKINCATPASRTGTAWAGCFNLNVKKAVMCIGGITWSKGESVYGLNTGCAKVILVSTDVSENSRFSTWNISWWALKTGTVDFGLDSKLPRSVGLTPYVAMMRHMYPHVMLCRWASKTVEA